MKTTLEEAQHCCGTCAFAVWLADNEGECHGGYWDVPDPARWHLPRAYRPTIKVRPLLLNKGYGVECQKWMPALPEILPCLRP